MALDDEFAHAQGVGGWECMLGLGASNLSELVCRGARRSKYGDDDGASRMKGSIAGLTRYGPFPERKFL